MGLIKYAGIAFAFFGFFGGFELLGQIWPGLNTVDRDQIAILFGITWFWIAEEKGGSDE